MDPDPSATLIAVIKIPYNKLQSDKVLKGIVQPFELKGVNRLIRSAVKLEVRQFFSKLFNDTISREEHKTINSGLRISEMTLSNQSHFPRFFVSPESHLIGL